MSNRLTCGNFDIATGQFCSDTVMFCPAWGETGRRQATCWSVRWQQN